MKYLFFTFALVVMLASCDKEPVGPSKKESVLVNDRDTITCRTKLSYENGRSISSNSKVINNNGKYTLFTSGMASTAHEVQEVSIALSGGGGDFYNYVGGTILNGVVNIKDEDNYIMHRFLGEYTYFTMRFLTDYKGLTNEVEMYNIY